MLNLFTVRISPRMASFATLDFSQQTPNLLKAFKFIVLRRLTVCFNARKVTPQNATANCSDEELKYNLYAFKVPFRASPIFLS